MTDCGRRASLLDGWDEVEVREVAELNPESVSKSEPPVEIVYIDIAAVSSDGIDRAAVRALDFAHAPSRARRVVRKGDTIVSTVRPYLRARALTPSDMDGWVVSTGFCVIRPGPALIPGYLDAATSTDEFYAHLASRQTGTAYPAVRADDIGDARIALPPLSEQRRITDLLGAFDRVIVRARDHVTSLRRLAEPTRRQMLTLGGRDVLLRDLVVSDGIQIGPFGSQLHASDYRPEGTPVVMPRDMLDGRIEMASIARIGPDDANRLARHRLEVGDILLPRRGDLGKRALVREGQEGWLCGTGSVRIRVPRDQSRLVFEALSRDETTRWLVSHAVGTTMPNLNTEIVGSIPVVIPVADQAQPYLSSLEAIEALERRAKLRLESLRDARSAAVSALLSGGHRLPDTYDRFVSPDALSPIPVAV